MRRFVLPLFLGAALLAAAQTPSAPQSAAAQQAADERPVAVIHTSKGEITCTLFDKEAPKTVENFIGLAEGTREWVHPTTKAKKKGEPLYSGTIFHRVIPNFMIQGGDPAGTGSGGPGYQFADEIVAGLRFDRAGRLAMANAGPGTNGSQFFITEAPVPHLNGRHTIFGQCRPVTLVGDIARVPRDPRNDRPYTAVKIERITIKRPGQATPAAQQPGATQQKKPAAPAQKPAPKPNQN